MIRASAKASCLNIRVWLNVYFQTDTTDISVSSLLHPAKDRPERARLIGSASGMISTDLDMVAL